MHIRLLHPLPLRLRYGVRSTVINVSVCLPVRDHISETNFELCRIFHAFWQYSPLRCHTFDSSGFVDDVLFSHSGPFEQALCSRRLWGLQRGPFLITYHLSDFFVSVVVAGFTGEFCEEEIDECEPVPCKNGATCIDLRGKYQCICLPGIYNSYCHCCRHYYSCHFKPLNNFLIVKILLTD